MQKLKFAHLKRYKVAEFAAFCLSVKELIAQAGAENLGLKSGLFEQFGQKLALLNDAVNATQGSDKTPIIAQYDEERDRYFRYIRNVLANLRNSIDPHLAALYETANTKILRVYPASIAHEASQQETAHLTGFIVDMRKYFGDELSKLGIASALTALETANGNFQKTYLARTEELSNYPEGATQQYRAELEQLYAQIEVTVNYWATLTGATDEASIERQLACADFTNVLNEYIDELWLSIKVGRALSKEGGTSGSKPSGGGSGSSSKPSGGNTGGNTTAPGSDDIL